MTDDDEVVREASGESPPFWSAENDPDGYAKQDVIPNDWILDYLLTAATGPADDGDGNIRVTLTCGGVVVTGTVISGTTWIAGMDALLCECAREIGEGFKSASSMLATDRAETRNRRNALGLPVRAREFMHLRDVQLGSGNSSTSTPLWRAPMSEISGWALGVHPSE